MSGGRAVRLTPSLREKIWGRTDLHPYFADSRQRIGEVWFTAERELPLLVKFIYTSERLSVQVHPADGECGPGSKGKTEMWHVLHAEPGAVLGLGFREAVRRERLRAAAHSGEILSLMNWIRVQPGESYFVPAHTVHAIGAGLVICEIQQNTDVTYRLYDYGRPRELHLDQALPLCDLGPHPGPCVEEAISATHRRIASCGFFTSELVTLRHDEECAAPAAACQLWTALEGRGTIGGCPYAAGEVWLIENGDAVLRAGTDSRLLRSYV